MSLSAAVKTGPERDPRRKCGLAEWLRTLDPSERGAAESMIADPTWSASAMHRAFVREGYTQTLNVVDRHRHQQCACHVTG